jgi:hypothetical protein
MIMMTTIMKNVKRRPLVLVGGLALAGVSCLILACRSGKPPEASGNPELDWHLVEKAPAAEMAKRNLAASTQAIVPGTAALWWFALSPERATGIDSSYSPSDDLAYAFGDYRRASDEFARKRIADNLWNSSVVLLRSKFEKNPTALAKLLLSARTDDLRVGEYDFQRKGFPVLGYGGTEELPVGFIPVRDDTKSAKLILDAVNDAGARAGRTYEAVTIAVIFDNNDDHALFTSFLRVDPGVAEALASDFDLHSRRLSAYVVFRLERADVGFSVQEGISYPRKQLHGRAVSVIIATPKGKVISVTSQAG